MEIQRPSLIHNVPLTTPLKTDNDLKADQWNKVDVETDILQPGLYVVSVNVVSHYSISLISQVAPAATPSLLTIVAGSFSDTPNTFPSKVFHDSSYPTAYFWVDVMFTPSY